MRRIPLLATAALLMTAMLAILAGTAAAHPHVASNPDPDQVIANGQLHPAFVYDPVTNVSTGCEAANDNSGPAFYGLETAHHGPDVGDPGKDDGCYAAEGGGPGIPPPDTNPGIS